jgi:nucleotidyltransferase substrate binding protein (TIGR01987 family)
MLPMRDDIRWKQRFQNFSRAFKLLQEAFDRDPEEMSDLEKEGAIQRFEYTFELAWKTLMDYLLYSGVAFDQITPRSVIKQAFAAKIIKDGQVWIDMLEKRNLMSHTYDDASFQIAFRSIAQDYLTAIEQVFTWLKARAQE